MSEVLIPGTLKEALRQYSDLVASMAADRDVREARDAVMLATNKLQAAQNALERAEESYRPKMKEVQEFIEANALEVEQSFEHAGYKVAYRKGYERVSYDTKGTDAILQKMRDTDNPLRFELAECRKVADVNPTAKLQGV